MANLALLDPNNYVNWFMTEFPDVQDDAGRSLPVTGASPAVRFHDDTGSQVGAALAGTRPSEQASGVRPKAHMQLLALSLVVGVILTILLLGLIAFRVQIAVK